MPLKKNSSSKFTDKPLEMTKMPQPFATMKTKILILKMILKITISRQKNHLKILHHKFETNQY